jgi:hypothetical protein
MDKAGVYEATIERMERALASGFFLEATWLAYCILEDRLLSLLESSGGVPSGVRMLGPKIDALDRRLENDAVVRARIPSLAPLRAWKDKRNILMHSMVDGSLSVSQIEILTEETARGGAELARVIATAARWVKKHHPYALRR